MNFLPIPNEVLCLVVTRLIAEEIERQAAATSAEAPPAPAQPQPDAPRG